MTIPRRNKGKKGARTAVSGVSKGKFVAEQSAQLERDAKGATLWHGFVDGINERKRIEVKLREEEDQFRAIFEIASIGMAQADPQTGQFLRVNQKMCTITGYSADELLKVRVSEVTHPDDRQRDWGEFQRVVSGMVPHYHIEKRYIRKDRSLVWVNVNMTVIRNSLGQPVRTIATVEDITERKRLEQEVLEISGQELTRIGQELHDNICQQLVGTSMFAEALARDLAKESSANALRALEIVAYTRHALASLRAMAHGLTPLVVESEGLTGALSKLAENIQEMFFIRCHCEFAGLVDIRDESAALHLYRIAQEAISNAVRHGGAHEVCIRLQAQEDRVSMVIRDNGSGIPQPLPQTPGMGLRSMRYRAGLIGATLEFRPGPNGGNEVICTFPKEL